MVDVQITGGIRPRADVVLPTSPAPEVTPEAPAAPPEGRAPLLALDPAAVKAALAAVVGFRVHIDMYVDDKGRTVQERTSVKGELPPGFPRYVGVAQAPIEVDGPRGKAVVQVPIQFTIAGAANIDDAFEFFDGCAQEEQLRVTPEVKARYERPSIITPAAAMPKGPAPHAQRAP